MTEALIKYFHWNNLSRLGSFMLPKVTEWQKRLSNIFIEIIYEKIKQYRTVSVLHLREKTLLHHQVDVHSTWFFHAYFSTRKQSLQHLHNMSIWANFNHMFEVFQAVL